MEEIVDLSSLTLLCVIASSWSESNVTVVSSRKLIPSLLGVISSSSIDIVLFLAVLPPF